MNRIPTLIVRCYTNGRLERTIVGLESINFQDSQWDSFDLINVERAKNDSHFVYRAANGRWYDLDMLAN